MKFAAMMKTEMSGLSIRQRKLKSAMKLVFDFEPEAIHVMRFGETEEEFDKRLEAYDEDEP